MGVTVERVTIGEVVVVVVEGDGVDVGVLVAVVGATESGVTVYQGVALTLELVLAVLV